MGKNKVRYGLCNVHIAKAILDESTGLVTYETTTGTGGAVTPVVTPLPGAVSLSLDPEGESTAFHADNIVYFRANTNIGYTGDLELALIPDWFSKTYLGYTEDANHVLVEKAEVQEPQHFAMMFEFDGDKKKIRHVLYWCSASRPGIEGQTKEDSVEPQTETLNFSADPRPDNQLVKAKTGDQTAQATYDSWYTQVYVPNLDSNGNISG